MRIKQNMTILDVEFDEKDDIKFVNKIDDILDIIYKN